MAKMWDDRLKRIFSASPQDFVSWLLPGAHFVEKVSLELKGSTRTVNADCLYKVVVHGQRAILHVEFQKRVTGDMLKRIWEYNVLATLQHDCPVYTFVIYLVAGGEIAEPPLEWGLATLWQVHAFDFRNIKLWELPIAVLRSTNLKGLLPLFVLTQGGKNIQVAKEVFEQLKGERELLSLAFLLASMVFQSEAEQQWLEGRIAMLEDVITESWYFQYILKKGLQEGQEQGMQQGIQQGMQQGMQQGRVDGLRIAVSTLFESKFPQALTQVETQIHQLSNMDGLHALIARLGEVEHEAAAVQAIREAAKREIN